MSNLDLYLRSLVRFEAEGVVLKSGANVTLKFPAGDRHATQTTTHDQLQQMVGAAAPSEALASIMGGGTASFPYQYEGKTFHVTVTPGAGEWVVAIDSKAAPAPAASALPIERNQYAATGPARPEVGLAIEPTAHVPTPVPKPPPTQVGLGAAAPKAASGGGARLWVDELLFKMKDAGASDLHLSSGCQPFIRESGHIMPVDGYEDLDPDQLLKHLYEIIPEKNRLEFEESHDTDFAHSVEGLSRFRVNMFRDRKGPGAVMRAIPYEIPSAEQLGIPKACLELCKLTKGLVLVTGPTGSGKSTTLAALIDHVNDTRNDHIITIEDPIEFVHENKKCLVNQREVHTHTGSFKNALRAALREDPDIVLVGEMRDLETIAIAVETAETGHLVFGTLHTSTAPSTVDRIIDQFPADRQEQIRQMLAESLKGVIAQVLCRRRDKGRVAAHEILMGTSAVTNIIREKKTFQLFSIMQTGRKLGMQTMNDALIDLVKRGIVDPNEAYMKAVNKAEFKTLLGRAGVSLPS